MDVETYARHFLRARGCCLGGELSGDRCIQLAANLYTEESAVVVTLFDLRKMAQMAQFSERECPPAVLRFIEKTGHLSGEAWVELGKNSVDLILDKTKIEARELM